MRLPMITVPLLPVLLAACQQTGGNEVPGDTEDQQPYAGITEDVVLQVAGTEPFWGGTIDGDSFTYTTPENIEGRTITVTRFAGRGGLSFSGELEGSPLDLVLTEGACSDGMSDRSYPLVATLQIGEDQRAGCGWREGDDLGPPP